MSSSNLFPEERIEEWTSTRDRLHQSRQEIDALLRSIPPHVRLAIVSGSGDPPKEFKKAAAAYRDHVHLVNEWHRQYEALWPPDLVKAIWSPTGSSQESDLLIQFLEEDPFFFRSGYAKEITAKRLLKVELSEAQLERIAALCLRSLHGVTRREFRFICRLARRIRSRSFLSELRCALDDPSTRTRRHALWMTEALSPAGGYPYGNFEAGAHMRLKWVREFLDERLERESEL